MTASFARNSSSEEFVPEKKSQDTISPGESQDAAGRPGRVKIYYFYKIYTFIGIIIYNRADLEGPLRLGRQTLRRRGR
jgi:hypothetical protein